MGMRRIGSSQRKKQRAKTHKRNAKRKTRERVSRDRSMVEAVKHEKFRDLPWVMSWLGAKLDKPPGAITQEDVDKVVASVGASAA
jgi:hypothetical protein